MKRMIFLFGMLLTIMLSMSSCSTVEADLSEKVVNQEDNVALKRLQEYNEMMMSQRPQTRGKGNKKLIASADIIGAVTGMYMSKEIGLGMGLATGGIGMIATMIGGGILYGASSSYLTYRICKGYSVSADEFYKYSLNQLILNVRSDTMNFYNKYVYEPQKVDIKLPPGFKNLQAVGEMHNQLILGVDYENPSPQGVGVKNPLEPIDKWTPPSLEEKELICKSLNSTQLKERYDLQVETIKASVINGLFSSDTYMEKNPIGNEKVTMFANANAIITVGKRSLEALRLQPLGKPPQCFS